MVVLNKENVLNLYNSYLGTVQLINESNLGQPNYMLIKQIQIPVNLSHSIAYLHILNNPNLVGTNQIEVKSSGTSNFQRFRRKAISSNLVIWMKIHDSFLFDILTFNPIILSAQGRNELEVNWDKIIENEEITLVRNLNLTNI